MAQETPPPAAAADARPGLEVATIKPSLSGGPRFFRVDGLKLRTSATTVADLMTFAYSMHSAQIIGGPQWIRTDRYDVVMQPNLAARPSTAQMRVIVQQLLADRFRLAMHHETKELQVYAIVPSKRGAHLAPVAPEEAAGNTAAGGYMPGAITARNATVAEFANLMNRYMQLQWPVVDDTHLAGKFDFDVKWTPEEGERAGTSNGATPQELFAAMDEQLGLELKATKEPVDVLVIDGVERPEAN
jgi:uncharacterized protein (TIGR03435 family)